MPALLLGVASLEGRHLVSLHCAGLLAACCHGCDNFEVCMWFICHNRIGSNVGVIMPWGLQVDHELSVPAVSAILLSMATWGVKQVMKN